MARPSSARPTALRPPGMKRPQSAFERLCQDMEARIAKNEEMKEKNQRIQMEKQMAAARPPVQPTAPDISELDPDENFTSPSEIASSEMDISEPDFPPGYSGCLPRRRRPAQCVFELQVRTDLLINLILFLNCFVTF